MWFRLPFGPLLNAFKEIANVNFKDPRYVPQPTRHHAVCANFVFLNLLGGDTNGIGKLRLGHAKLSAALTDALPDMMVNIAPASVMQGMGLKVIQLRGGEIMPALERGDIAAFEFNNPTADSRFGAQYVSKHYHMGSYHQAAEFFEIIFNKGVFDGLAKEHQAILEFSAEAASTANYGRAMDIYSMDLKKLIDEHGVNAYRTAKSILEAQLASWDKVIEGLNEDPFFKKVADSQKSWAARVAFYDIVNAADHKLAYEHHFPGKLPF